MFFLIQRNWIVFQWPFFSSSFEEMVSNNSDVALRKKISFFYYKDEKFFKEESTLVWFSCKSENLKHLVNSWLVFLQEERLIDKAVYLESVALSDDGQSAYFSFNQSFLSRDWSIFKKWNFTESMLKTISNSKLGIDSVFFLVGHRNIEDDHLDFSQSWPTDGFLEVYA